MAKDFSNLNLRPTKNPIEQTLLNNVEQNELISSKQKRSSNHEKATTYTIKFTNNDTYFKLQALASIKEINIKTLLEQIIESEITKAELDSDTAKTIKDKAKLFKEVYNIKTK